MAGRYRGCHEASAGIYRHGNGSVLNGGQKIAQWRLVKSWARSVLASAGLVGLYFSVPLHQADTSSELPTRIAVAIVCFCAVIWLVGRQVQRAVRQDMPLGDRVSILFMIVTLVVVFFAAVYYVIGGQFHGIATRIDALYFTVVTLCTVGYGDIVPVSQAARSIAMVQMIFDLVIVTSAISIVVGALRQ